MPAHHFPRPTTRGLEKPAALSEAQTSSIWVFKTPENRNHPPDFSRLASAGADSISNSL
jgi:hypothetical protein